MFCFAPILILIFVPALIFALPFRNDHWNGDSFTSGKPLLWLTISANRWLEVSWINAPVKPGDLIIITNVEPQKNFVKRQLNLTQFEEGSGDYYNEMSVQYLRTPYDWKLGNGQGEILTTIQPHEPSEWINTGLIYDLAMSHNVAKDTKCYGYWVSYIDWEGAILSTSCLRAYPTWMNDMKAAIGNFRIRDLLIPGSHDSGSYRIGFNPGKNETIVTKYSLTQDEDIRAQCMHGIRYFDLRVAYYRLTEQEFFINHGITRQVPLRDVLNQIRDFVFETNEIVILDFQEFPIGFGKDLTIHRKLVNFVATILEGFIIHPSVSWQVMLRDVWRQKKNIFLSYDQPSVVAEFPNFLFQSCEQRWGDVRDWPNLERHLRSIQVYDRYRLSSRPTVDMAELTPDVLGIITDRYGGLRKMADSVNSKVTKLYHELGTTANIVAVDFYRGTSIVDLAIYFNYKKVIL